jgi:hypothetical protein
MLGVFTAIGCCRRTCGDTVMWHGMACVPPTFVRLQKDAHADFADVTLRAIVECQSDVSISALTIAFVLCFLGLQKCTLDIKQISRYLSGQSTLCRMYQVAHILEAAGVVERSVVPREITIAPPYFVPIPLNVRQVSGRSQNSYAISSLLVHAIPTVDEILRKREAEFLAGREKAAPREEESQ